MNIVYVSNEGYARHLGVSICSLFDSNADEERLEVFILDTGITPDSREKLTQIARSFGRTLTFIQLKDLEERFAVRLDTGRSAVRLDTGRFDVSTMGRLFAADLLPAGVRRVLYLDCDTVVLKPLRRLWETGLGKADGAGTGSAGTGRKAGTGTAGTGYVMAAVQEPTIYEEVKEYLGMRKEDPYFNAGVLLIDLKRWRTERLTDKVISYYAEIAEQSLFNDQDALNGLLKGRIRTLSPRWNFFTNYRYFRYDTLCRMQPAYRRIPEEVFRKAKRSPAVIHYAGDERPWRAGALNYYGKAYERYLAMTPWKDTPKEKGKELFLLLYHGMELVTPVFPFIRAAISRAYVRKCIAARKARQEKK
ncbi:MAG: glycosyltransferase family 8 protein [Stomatobaculum sp.]|nr:glycosyltransferase family 8 protein [Stomatobaculum sp.]